MTQKILLRNESGIAHIPASYVFPTDIESDRRRRSSSRFDTCRSRFIHTFSLFAKGENMLCYISEQGTLPGILMADLNVKRRAGSLCTVIFGRPLKFPPVVLAWRIDFRAEGFVSFRQGNFPPMGSDKIKRAKNRIAKFCNRQASTSQSSKRGIYYGQTFFFFFLLITKESSPRHRLRHELELFQICSTPNVNNRGHFSRREYVD